MHPQLCTETKLRRVSLNPNCGARHGDVESKLQMYDPKRLVAALKAGRPLRSTAVLFQAVSDIVSFACPTESKQLQQQLVEKHLKLPSKWALARVRSRFGIAAMLCEQRANRDCRATVWRYVAPSSSPKYGMEIFAARHV